MKNSLTQFQTYKYASIQAFFAILFFFLSVPLAEAAAVSWNATDWTEYEAVVIDATNIDETLTDFPVYVDLSDLPSEFWSTTPTSSTLVATDIRITDSSNTELPRELVSASSSAQTGELYFKANSISASTDTTFKIWYNGTTTGDYTATSTNGSENVWTNGFIAVYHLEEDGSVTNYLDATGNGNVGTPASIDVADQVSGKLGNGLNTDGTPEGVTVADSTDFDWTVGGISGWLQTDTVVADGTLAARGSGGNSEMLLWFDEGVDDITCAATIGGSFYNGSSGGTYTTRPTGQWLHGFCSWDGTNLTNYVNGSSNFTTSGPSGNLANDSTIGGIGREGPGNRYLDGRVDEVRFHSAGRSAAWVKAEYENQASTTNFYTVSAGGDGGEESGGRSVLISGTLYENDGTTPVTESKVITVGYGNGSGATTSTTTNGSGDFSIELDGFVGDTVLTDWSAVSAAGNNDLWRDVNYADGVFVAVGKEYDGEDYIMSSFDGVNWTARSVGGGKMWSGADAVTYGNGLHVAVGGFTGSLVGNVATSPDGITWTARSASNDNDRWQGITYGNGLFVAVARTGDRVMTSPDGINWTARSAVGNDDGWYDVTYGNGLFVAVGNTGDRVMTSPDGITWTARSAAGDNDSWQSVTYGNGLFVAVGYNGDRVMTSLDGISWTARSTPADSDWWQSVAYGDGLFIAVKRSGDRVMTSPDGITWTAQSASGNNDDWYGVTFGGGKFVAVGEGNTYVMTADIITPDEVVPLTVYVDDATSTQATTLTYLNGSTTVSGIDLHEDTLLIDHTSNGDIDLTADTFFDFDEDEDVVFDVAGATTTVGLDTRFVDLSIAEETTFTPTDNLILRGDLNQMGSLRVGTGTTTLMGANITATGTLTGLDGLGNVVIDPASQGASWKTTPPPSDSGTWEAVTYAEGLFVAVGSSGDYRVMTSPDGVTWTERSAAGNNDSWKSITYGDGIFVAVAEGGDHTVMTSPDGITWTGRLVVGNDDSWQSVSYGNGLFVAVGGVSTQDRVMTSPDGITWTARSAAGNNDSWQAVAYGNGLFVAVGNNGDRIMTSPDGITWTVRTATTGSWEDVAYGNGLFVTVAASGATKIATSPDGITWTTRTTPLAAVYAVTHANGVFVTTGKDLSSIDQIGTSADGITWVQRDASGMNVTWNSITDNGHKIVAVSPSMFAPVLISTDGVANITTASIANVLIEEGKELISSSTLDISNSLTSNGIITNEGVLLFSDTSELTLGSTANSFLGDVEITGTTIFNNAATTTNLTVSSAGDFEAGSELEVRGNFTQDGVIDFSSTVLFLSNGSTTISGTLTGTDALGDVVVGSADEVDQLPGGGGDGEIVMTAGVYTDSFTTHGYEEGVFGSLSNTSSIGLSALGVIEFGGSYFGSLAVPDTSPALASFTSDDVSYDLEFSSTQEGVSNYSFNPGSQIFSDGVQYDITLTDDSGTVYGGGGGSGPTDTVTFSSPIEIDDLDITVSKILVLEDRLVINNDFTNYGQLSAGTAEMVFGGVATQTATGTLSASSSLYDLTISNASQDGDINQSVIFGAPLSVSNDFLMTGGTSVAFLANSTSTLQNIDLRGSTGNELYLRSTASSTAWGLDVTGEQNAVQFVNVRDSHASTTIEALNSTDVGNNINWTFATGSPPMLYDEITISATAIDEDLVNFPVYVDLADLSTQFWSTVASDGGDIRVTTEAGMSEQLPREVVTINTGNQTGELHFKAGLLSSTEDSVFRIHYSGSVGSGYASTSPYGANNVWSDTYLAVYHGGGGEDSTSAVRNASGIGGAVAGAVAGQIGNASEFSGSSQGFQTGDMTGINGLAAVTVSTWFEADAVGTNRGIYTLNNAGIETAGDAYTRIRLDSSGASGSGTNVLKAGIRNDSTSFINGETTSGDATTNWTLVHHSWESGSAFEVHLDGGQTSFSAAPATLAGVLSADELTIGAGGQAPGYWDGIIDEFRIASTSLSDAWIAAEYANQSSPATFYSAESFAVSPEFNATVTDHDAGQVSDAFSFQNKTNEELFAFKLIPETGTATVTAMTFSLFGVSNVTDSDFSNVRLLRDLDDDADYDASDEVVDASGVLSINTALEVGTIIFTGDFLSGDAQNYIVVADWNAPESRSIMNIALQGSSLVAENDFGVYVHEGVVTPAGHSRTAAFGGGGSISSEDIGGAPPVGDGIIIGGGEEGGELIGSDPNFLRPSAASGGWTNTSMAYDGIDGTYATSGPDTANESSWSNHGFNIAGANTIEGIEVKLEASKEGATTATWGIEVELSWDGGVSWTTPKSSVALEDNDIVMRLGDASDLWGRSWTVSEFSDANFRVRLAPVIDVPGTTSADFEIKIDEIQVRVYNQAGGGGAGGGVDI